MPSKRKTKHATNGVHLERNWSELPQEILHLFSKKLLGIFDFICFCAVCKSWRLSAPVTDPLPQLPWLVECCEDSKKQRENSVIRFYYLLSDKVHTIFSPGSRRVWLEGPAYCYLLASQSRSPSRSYQMYLLNPLTHDEIFIPLVNICVFPDYIGTYPIEGNDIVIISGDAEIDNYVEANDWIYVEGAGNSANAFYMRQYFSNDEETSITNVIDIDTKELAYHVALAPPENTNPLLEGCTILVESGAKILRLFQYYESEQCHFDIYCLYFSDSDNGKPSWVKIVDIRDQMLFLQYYHGFSFCSSNFAGFKGNCIYFLKGRQYLCKYDIRDSTTEVLPCPFDLVETWFVPSLV